MRDENCFPMGAAMAGGARFFSSVRRTGMVLLATASAMALATQPARAQTAEAASPGTPVESSEAAQTEQEGAASDNGDGEIVVTAQRRVERLQDVPISIAAVSGEAIENLQAVNLQSLQGTVTNLQLSNFSNTPLTASISIRGIGVSDPDPYVGNTVSIVYDGVPQYFNMGALVDLYDIDRVEVLRGPQGTLFGANTTGGVINVLTRQPTQEFGGRAQITYGNYDRLDIGVALNLPIASDLAALRIVGSHSGRDGWITNVFDGSDMGSRDVTLLRANLLLTPSPNFKATLMGEYVRARNGAAIVVNGAVPGEALYIPAGTPGPQNGVMYEGPCVSATLPCRAPNRYLSANDQVPDQSDMDSYRGVLTLSLDNTPIGNITSITGYQHFRIVEWTDQDGSPLPLFETFRDTAGWQFSQELRTSVDLGDMIDLTAGAFYLRTHYGHLQGVGFLFQAPGVYQRNLQDQDNWSASAFAQAYIHVTDKLTLQAGIRYTQENTEMLASTTTYRNPDGRLTYRDPTGSAVVRAVAPPAGEESWGNIGWRLGFDYDVTEDAMVYGYWARGFKSGGFVGRLGNATDLGPFGPETVDTFEGGFKLQFLNRRLTTNFAAFYSIYRDVQVASIYNAEVNGVNIISTSILNAAKAKIKGFELDVTAKPIDGLTLTGTLAHLDAQYSDFPFVPRESVTPTTPLGVPVNLRGERLQNAPKWSATAGFAYEFPVGPGSLAIRGMYSYVASKFLTDVRNLPRTYIQPTHLVDGGIDWTPTGDNWSLGLWGRNLLDNRYMASVFPSTGFIGFAAYAPPREFGATLRVSW